MVADPNKQTIDGLEIDPAVVKVMKAIRQVESNGNYNARGDGGAAFGAFQYNEQTGPGWKNIARQYLGDENAPMTPANQNKATYIRIKQWKDEGLQPEEIAARWNGASRDANGTYVYNNPEYGEKFRQALMGGGTGGNYTPPPVPEPYVAPEQPVSERPDINPVTEVGKGVLKGAVGRLVDVSRMGEGILNQTVGRGVNAILGNGLKPLSVEQRQNPLSITVAGSPAASKLDETIASKNKYQTGGKIAETVAEFLVPSSLAAKGLAHAKRIAGAGKEALEIVAPKLNKKTITQGLSRGLGGRNGSQITLDADEKTIAAAKAIEDLVKTSTIRAKDTVEKKANAVLDEIGSVAEDLRSQLRNRDVQPILSPEELGGLIQRTKAKFEESPLLVGDAGKAAERIFNKFVSFLPKNRDIVAEDILDARQALDKWMKAEGRGSAFDPRTENAISKGLREIRQGANELLANKAEDVPTKAMFQRQSSLYDALENIIETGYKEVGTTGLQRLAKKHPYISGAIGSAVGGLLPVGLGAYAYDKIRGD